MKRSTLGWLAVAAGFVLVLAYSTLQSAGTPGAGDLARGGPGAVEACKSAAKSQVSTARFPFPTTVVDLGNGRYRLHGMLDERLADETVRRNYECVILFTDSAGYRADSLRVWQSH